MRLLTIEKFLFYAKNATQSENPFFDLQFGNRFVWDVFLCFWPIEQRYLLFEVLLKIQCRLDSPLVNPVNQTVEDILISFD